MSFFDTIILYITLIYFPFLFILLFKIKSNNELNLLINIASLSTLFLLLKYTNLNSLYTLVLINIPLIICFFYKQTISSIFILVLISIYYYFIGFNIVFVIIEYFFYLIVYITNKRSKENNKDILYIFATFKGIFLAFNYFFNNELISTFLYKVVLLTVLLFIITYFIVILIEKNSKHSNIIRKKIFDYNCEIKNPISVCKGYMQMMDYSNIEKVKKYNNIINEELDKTIEIMDNCKI